jgi:hypothetical protein
MYGSVESVGFVKFTGSWGTRFKHQLDGHTILA